MVAALAPYLFIMLCAAPWVLLLAPRAGARLAITTVAVAAPLLVLALLAATSPLGIAPVPALLVVSAALGLVGAALVARDRPRRPGAAASLAWLAAGTGAVAWLIVLGLAQVLPGADPLSWAMSGDATNNIQQARSHIASAGLDLANGAAISVPLTSTLLSVSLALGRPAGDPSALLAHDLAAAASFWGLVVMVTSTLIGLVASSLVRRARGLVAACFSLLGATWIVTGLPMESGYLNGPLSVSLLLLTWLAYGEARRSPILSTCALLALSLLTLATWTPLVVVVGSLLLAVVAQHRSSLGTVARRDAAALVVLVLAILGWIFGVISPAFAQNSPSLSNTGHGFPSTYVLLGGAAALAVALAIWRRGRTEVIGVVTVSVAAIVGIGALVVLAASGPDPLGGYYPTKFSWMLLILVAVVAVALALAALEPRLPSGWLRPAFAGVAAVALVLASLGPVPSRTSPDLMPPFALILGGHAWNAGDESAAEIIDHVGQETLLYDSGQPDEAFINFWLIDFGAGGVGEDYNLRSFAVDGYRELRDTGRYDPVRLDEFCPLIGLLGDTPTIITQDAGLEARIAAQCDVPELRVVVE